MKYSDSNIFKNKVFCVLSNSVKHARNAQKSNICCLIHMVYFSELSIAFYFSWNFIAFTQCQWRFRVSFNQKLRNTYIGMKTCKNLYSMKYPISNIQLIKSELFFICILDGNLSLKNLRTALSHMKTLHFLPLPDLF